MALNRDNFTSKTIDILAKRVGFFCSNPGCKRPTVGPNVVRDKFTIVGVAAHITAASPGGPRYDENLSTEQRKSIDNGIWLCTDCSTIIDKDPLEYPVELLNDWKRSAENDMSMMLKVLKTKERPSLEADLIWSSSQRFNNGYSYKNKELYGDYIIAGINKPIIFWNLMWNFNMAIYNNSRFPAFNVSVEQIDGPKLSSIDKLPRINNLPPYANLNLNARFEDNYEGTSEDADKLIIPKVPPIVQGLQLRLTYYDEEGQKFSTIFTVRGDEFINEKN